MYYDYFGLSEAPFSIAPNPEYLFMTERHQEALAHLYHGIESEAGFVLLTGDIGTGKTTICRCFLENMTSETEVAFILNPYLDGKELLQAICQELKITGVPEAASLRQLTDFIYRHLLENHAKGKNTVLLIDEAQHIHIKVLELIRLLTNLETATQKLLKIILVGQPELNDLLAKPELTQLSQRITARYHIKPLNYDEVASYMSYRLRMAGYASEKKLFPDNVIKAIFKFTGGVPRLINVICDRVLLGTYVQNKATSDLGILKNAIREIHGEDALKPRIAFSWRNSITLLGVLLIGLLLGIFYPALLNQSGTSPLVTLAKRYLPSSSVDKSLPPVLVAEDAFSEAAAPDNTSDLASPEILENRGTPSIQKDSDNNHSPVYYTAQSAAMNELISSIHITTDMGVRTCRDLDANGWQCRSAKVENWQAFMQYNRPAVLILASGNDDRHFLAVSGVAGDRLRVSYEGHTTDIALAQFADQWTGDFVYLWQPPAGFDDFIYFDSDATIVNWLAAAFARMDNQTELLAHDQYNSLLKQRVILFQKQNNLIQDGIAGIQTLLKLNEALGLAVTLNTFKTGFSSLETPVN